MTPTILFYNLNNPKGQKIKFICMKLKIRMKFITPEQYLQPVGSLAGIKELAATDVIYEDEGFKEEMLVMKDFSNQLLDSFLYAFRQNKVDRVNLKAILTPENIRWNSLELYEELKKEHEAMNP